jgi:phosphatidylserine/phosphatidylglycerophosphate/cardiolipin synthase-like enzyme
LELFTEPLDGDAPIIELIGGAQRSLDLTMYELTDRSVEAALVAAHRRGVDVRVLLDDRYAGSTVNRAAYSQLTAAGVSVRWGSGDVIFHQKTLTVDGEASAIMTGNLTDDEVDTRDFVVIDRDQAAVSVIISVFDTDWDGAPVTDGPDVDGLVWSPGATTSLLDLIHSARRSLVVENEEIDSAPIESALESASRRGVIVEVVMTAQPRWDRSLDQLSASGVRVATYPDAPGVLYVHAKAIVADTAIAFVGSENFSTSSLDDNRELGVITSDPRIVRPLLGTLTSDFDAGAPWGAEPG